VIPEVKPNPCFHRSPKSEGDFNHERVERVIQFIETFCLVTEGPHVGQPMKLREWQKEFIRDVYGPTRENNLRLIRQAIFSMPKKNGKTGLMAPLLLVHFVGPESEPNGEIYSAANDRLQASIIFDAVKALIEVNPTLASIIDIFANKTMIVKPSSGLKRCQGSKFRALSADASTKQGFKPSLIIYDELGEAPNAKLLTALRYGFASRKEPLFVAISTQSHDPQHPMSILIDDGLTGQDPTTACHLYAAPDDAAIDDREVWFGCNPALGDFRDLGDFEAQAGRAARLPSEEQGFRLYLYNQRVSMHASLIPQKLWKRAADDFEIEEKAEVYLALDQSGRFDLTALSILTVEPDFGTTEKPLRTSTLFWKPADLLREHSNRDGFDYVAQHIQGNLRTSPKESIDPMVTALAVVELATKYRVKALAYDRWKIDEFLRCLDHLQFEAQIGPGDGLRLEPWGQGYRDMDVAVNALQAAITDDRLRHDDNPIQNFCVSNAITTQDPTGARKLDKSKSRFRIDGAVTLAMALGLMERDRTTSNVITNPFEDPTYNPFAGAWGAAA
jgi:phage terminase large subunit-like protein